MLGGGGLELLYKKNHHIYDMNIYEYKNGQISNRKSLSSSDSDSARNSDSNSDSDLNDKLILLWWLIVEE